ncbi:hypothetical protein WHJ98_14555, partial [Staphylococcus aureus]|uniref:hypothetical protein n=1 Tax=Staphylococcus aureus TaxID=1280 RepID=UPI0039BE9ADB
DGPDNHADLSLPPLALAHWLGTLSPPTAPQAASQPELPPGNGTLHVAKLQIGSLDIAGLSVEAGASAPAAASSTANKPSAGGAPR